jgi:hypothetical protein
MKVDLTEKVFGKLKVISENVIRSASGGIRWNCQCECGNITTVASNNLMKNHTRSCGCLNAEVRITHGMSDSAEYLVWYSMIKRCTNADDQAYHNYGGRGITVCDRWLNNFEAFYEDMGARPSPDHTLDRKENDGNYEKNNCRWATHIEQNNNKRNNVFYEYGQEQLTLSEISRRTGISYTTLYKRINRDGLSISQAITKPIE